MLPGGEQPGLPFVPEPVALATDVEHMAVVQQPLQDGRGDDRIAQASPHSPNSLLEVRMMDPRSCRADTRVKRAVADSRS